MKMVYEVKLIEKGKDASAVVDTMVAHGWEMHKLHASGMVFRRSVPDNYISVWVVVERGNKDGKEIEVKHGPYHSLDAAENIIEASTFVRIDKLWIPPEDDGGGRMDRVARFAVAEPTDPGAVCMDDVQPPRKKKDKRTAVPLSDGRIRVTPTMEELIAETEQVRLGIRGLNIPNMPDPPPAPMPTSRRRPVAARGPAPRVGTKRHGAARPQQQQVRMNILDSMRNFGKKVEPPAVIELGPAVDPDVDPNEPTEEEINNLADRNRRILQSMRREHNQ